MQHLSPEHKNSRYTGKITAILPTPVFDSSQQNPDRGYPAGAINLTRRNRLSTTTVGKTNEKEDEMLLWVTRVAATRIGRYRDGLHWTSSKDMISPPDFRKTSIHQSISKTRTRLYREEAYTTIIGLFGADGMRICKNKSNINVRLIRIICLHHKRNIKMVKRLSNWAVLTQLSWANSSFGRSKLQPTYSDLTKSLGERSPTLRKKDDERC